jgi:hypothetical protein
MNGEEERGIEGIDLNVGENRIWEAGIVEIYRKMGVGAWKRKDRLGIG